MSDEIQSGMNSSLNEENQDSNSRSIDQNSYAHIEIPTISLPTGGGAIKGIEEKFQVNSVSGTSSFSIPIPISPARLTPAMGLSYSSGTGNGPFGLGWRLSTASIIRKTEKKLPLYHDEEDSDTFIFSGAEDLVPVLTEENGEWKKHIKTLVENGINYHIKSYRPRIEGLFARIEFWENKDTNECHWRTISKDNIHSYYGLTADTRISDPSNDKRVFEWLLCKTHNDKGSIILYQYKKEDFVNIDITLSEKNQINKCTQTYLKKVCYGNKTPYYLGNVLPEEDDFMFKVVLDYGEHDSASNIPKDIEVEKNLWACRKDPFSTHRSGFNIRTYRRCNRILVLHCFDELPHNPYLTKSLDIIYDENLDLLGNAKQLDGFSFLVSARQNGHLWDAAANHYQTKYLPEIEISYQQHEWNTEIKTVSDESLINAPAGLADKRFLWVDLFNEGLSGILKEELGALYYKYNEGNGHFSPAVPVSPKPSFGGLGKNLAIQDLEGNGIKYLVQVKGTPKGFFKFTEEEQWESMRPFDQMPTLQSANIRAIDLNADGKLDLLISEENAFLWYEGLGEKGFKVGRKIFKEIDEEKGPSILFENRDHSIFLADMSGDGLTDIVRIRNGEICYWPNLGYGNFGPRVTMDNSPWFDHPDAFDPAYLRLADIDQSGTTDIVYLGKNQFTVWMNQNGNGWTLQPQVIDPFPAIHQLADVSVLDFLGNGTACIVYSSSIDHHPLQYIDLMGSKKPHLLTGYQNNCGKEVRISYKPSTYYYLNDKKEGKKWVTKLPFVVHCIASVLSEDKIRKTVFTNTYTYHHGYYDFAERDFRGFARVEQLDTETFENFKLNEAKNVVEEQFHQPPVRSVSWFHTGAFLQRHKILHQCEAEYFDNQFFDEYNIPEPQISDWQGNPLILSADLLAEAMRACKGVALRSEVYADDESEKSKYPYTASQAGYEIRLLQPKGDNKSACFLLVPSESVTYGYDRNPADPHISQSFILKADELGNPLQSVSVVYPRLSRPADLPDIVWNDQNKMHLCCSENLLTDDINTDTVYRLRTVYESMSFDLGGITPENDLFLTKPELKEKLESATNILFEEEFTVGVQKRLLNHRRVYFINDTLDGARPLGKLSPLGIGFKSQQLAFTKNLVDLYYGGKVTSQTMLNGKYVHSENDEHWWGPSGEYILKDDPKSNFFIAIGVRDLLGNESFVALDRYSFLTQSTTDAIGNKVTAQNDYRTLTPFLLTDPNLNRAAVETDALGMVIKSALMGKEGDTDGDTLADPTARLEYDMFNWKNAGKPNFAKTFAREKHGAANTGWQESYVYSDGSGGAVMAKSRTNAGKAKRWNAVTKEVEEVDADPRWIGNGRTIVNNKGKIIKQFEPYFSTTHEFESEDALVETGVSPTMYYDPVGRAIKTIFPNGTFAKVEFDAWHSVSFDTHDTIKQSPWFADRGSPDPSTITEPDDPDQRAAWLAAKHDNTPSVVHTDSLGRPFYSITDYGGGNKTTVYSETDPAGRFTRAFDQLGRPVSEGHSNLVGQTIYGKSAEKGENWVFVDALGRVVQLWDNAIREFRTTYDQLNRPLSSFVKQGPTEILYGHTVYGDLFPDAEAKTRNLKGKVFQLYDQSGVLTVKNVDFKGTADLAERRLTKEYKQLIDWSVLDGLNDIDAIAAAAEPILEEEIFTSSASIDALGRPITITLPDGSVFQPLYHEGNGLASLSVQIAGVGPFVPFLEGQDYDAKGQRQFAKFGNGTITKYFYDPKTFNLIRLLTLQNKNDADTKSLQDLKYTFDAGGNLTQMRDDAQQTHFFNNAVVYPESKFEYDAVYQLTKATGREHASGRLNVQPSNVDIPFVNQLPHQNDLTAVRRYTENYEYDVLGNIKRLQHSAGTVNWVQKYQYEYELVSSNKTNRLKATKAPGDADGIFSNGYIHDLHGNMTQMPHLSNMVWNFADQLTEVDLGGGGKAFYVYAAGGNRIRKVIERTGGKRQERIYLGSVEIYRERQGANAINLERYTVHVSDDRGRIAQIDTKTIDSNNVDRINQLNQPTIRYQYGNHLGSATLETDVNGNVISYEEYHPFGTSAYRVSKPDKDISLKRFRFSGKERDDETGLYYFGARYYAAWLGRWTSSDPAGFVSGFNVFRYCSNNPVMYHDPNGMDDGPVRDRPEKVVHHAFTGNESFEDLVAAGRSHRAVISEGINEDNYRQYYIPGNGPNGSGGIWNIFEREGSGSRGSGSGSGSRGTSSHTPGGTAPRASTGGGAPGGRTGGTIGSTGAGGSTPGDSTAGGSAAGGSTTGNSTTGGSTSGGSTAGGSTTGGTPTGGATTGGTTSGGTTAGGQGGSGSGTGTGNTDGWGGTGLWDSLPTWAKVGVAVLAVVAIVAVTVLTAGVALEVGVVAAEAAEVAAVAAETAVAVAETAEVATVVAETAVAATEVAETAVVATEAVEATTAATSLTTTATSVAANPLTQVAAGAATTEAARGGQDITAVANMVQAEAPVIQAAVNQGTNVVYRGFDAAGVVRYVGITLRDPFVRFAEHLRSLSGRADLTYEVVPGATNLSRIDARIWEQTLINQYGLGNLLNRINSIAPRFWEQYNIPPPP